MTNCHPEKPPLSKQTVSAWGCRHFLHPWLPFEPCDEGSRTSISQGPFRWTLFSNVVSDSAEMHIVHWQAMGRGGVNKGGHQACSLSLAPPLSRRCPRKSMSCLHTVKAVRGTASSDVVLFFFSVHQMWR